MRKGMDQQQFNQQLCAFIDASPSPFHATATLSAMLREAGFNSLREQDDWQLERGGKYFVTRNDSSIIAWLQGVDPLVDSGLNILGAHTDSPCLKVKPHPDVYTSGLWQLAVEVYGGALLNPWFDRDLSLAGRVHYAADDTVSSSLVDFQKAIAVIPNLAIHLDREANNNRTVNPQLHLPVLLASASEDPKARPNLNAMLLDLLRQSDASASEILDYELFFYDTQRAALIGVNQEFISAARLDNLLSCFIDAQALIAAAETSQWSMLICSDHEEVGSGSAAGAAGPFLQHVLQRISAHESAGDTNTHLIRSLSRSMLISTDNAHALHPNYADKMEPNHRPMLNAGPVIKSNANQRYASNSETQALFRSLCGKRQIPLQHFVMRNDIACGSTIGPITAMALGIKTLDVGVPTLAMHSIRELAGAQDPLLMCSALTAFLRRD